MAETTVTYRMYAHYRPLAVLGYLVLTAAGAGALIGVLATRPTAAGTLLVVAWGMISLWNAYWLLFRIAHELQFAGGRLQWRSPLASGSLDLADLRGLRPSRLGPHVEVLDVARGRPVVVWVRKGFVPFVDELRGALPGLRVTIGSFAGLAERLPGWRGMHRGRGPDA